MSGRAPCGSDRVGKPPGSMAKRYLFPLILMAMISTAGAWVTAPIISPEGVFALRTDGSRSPEFGRILASGEKEFLAQSGIPSATHPPVTVVLHPDSDESTSLPRLSVDAMEGGGARITVELRGTDRGAVSGQLLTTAMILREYYGNRPLVPGTRVPQYPLWVTRGMALLCFPAGERLHIPPGYLNGKNPPTLEDFLLQRAPDRGSPSLADYYDAMASLLLKAGLSSPLGRKSFRDWIGHHDDLVTEGTPPRWVSGWDMRSVERRWLLLMAGNDSREDASGKALKSVVDSLTAYDAVLAESLSGGATIASITKGKGGAFTLGNISSRLNALRLQANPMVLPLLDQTIVLLGKARKLSQKKISLEQQKLAELRTAIQKRSDKIEGYLDWYEAAKIPFKSGQYDRLLKSSEASTRNGPIGRYLDAVEARGW